MCFWRGKGTDPLGAGLVGRARIASLPVKKPDTSPAAPFWIDPSDAACIKPRVRLQILETRTRLLYYDDLKSDAILSKMTVFTVRISTNFRLSSSEVALLVHLWSL